MSIYQLVIPTILLLLAYNIVAKSMSQAGKTRLQVSGIIMLLLAIAISGGYAFGAWPTDSETRKDAWLYLVGFVAAGVIWSRLQLGSFKVAWATGFVLLLAWIAVAIRYHHPSPTPTPTFPKVTRGQILIPNEGGSETITLKKGEYLVVDVTVCTSLTNFDGVVDLLVTENGQMFDWHLPNGMWGKVDQRDVEGLGIKTQLPLRRYPDGHPNTTGKTLELSPDYPIVFYRTTPEDDEVKISFVKVD